MARLLPRNRSARLAQTRVVLGVTMLVLIAYAIPVVGLLASMLLPLVTHKARRYLWPEASNTHSIVWSLLAWAGLWLPGLVDFFTAAFSATGVEVSTAWLILPLCGPTGPAVPIPALAAAVTCLAGLLGTVVTGRGWSWVIAAWLAPWVHLLVFSWLPHEFIC